MIYLKKVSFVKKGKIQFKKFKISNPKLLNFKAKPQLLSDKDIVNLFMGFVRLIKKSAMFEIEKKYQNQIDYLTRRLNEKNQEDLFNNISRFKK